MAQNITSLAFDYLDAPPVVVGSRNWITPASEYKEQFYPQASWMIDAINEKLLPIPGYVSKHSYTNEELMRQARLGV